MLDRMDSITSYEFHKIFDRASDFIDFKGKFTVEAIETELLKARNRCRKLRRKAETSRDRAKFRRAAISYGNLLEYDFASRLIREAVSNPNGIIGMTLKHGKDQAKQRILAQKRAQIRNRLPRRFR
jgi:hypothetical protein